MLDNSPIARDNPGRLIVADSDQVPPTGGDASVWDAPRLSDPHTQPDKAARVRAMFDAIAPSYERVNRILSGGRDASWRRRAVRQARIRPADRVLDLACGTGDFARSIHAAGPARVVGCDFAAGMLSLAAARGLPRMSWCCADALSLPFSDESFDVVSCAFGIRNFSDCARGLREMHRVLAPAGRAVILEFSVPRGRLFGRLYRAYLHSILPRVAGWLSGDRTGAYSYLPRSVMSFMNDDQVVAGLDAAGFARVERQSLTGGVVTVYAAWK